MELKNSNNKSKINEEGPKVYKIKLYLQIENFQTIFIHHKFIDPSHCVYYNHKEFHKY